MAVFACAHKCIPILLASNKYVNMCVCCAPALRVPLHHFKCKLYNATSSYIDRSDQIRIYKQGRLESAGRTYIS